MSAWTVYWIMQADSVCALLLAFAIISCACCGLFTSVYLMSLDDSIDEKWIPIWQKFARPFWFLCPIALLLSTLFPGTKTLCACVAIPKIVNNEQIQGDLVDVYKLGMEQLKDQLSEKLQKKGKRGSDE